MKSATDFPGRTISQTRLVSAFALALALGVGFAAPAALADDSASPPPAAGATATPPATPPVASPPPLAAAPAANSGMSDKVAQENLFWESAQKSNTLADYKAYLDAFPNGLYAPLARNRIAALAQPAAPPPPASAPQQAGPGQQGQGEDEEANAPQQGGPQGMQQGGMQGMQQGGPQGMQQGGPQGMQQGAPPPDAVRAEVGTLNTEAALGLTRPDLKEIQRRLNVLGLYNGSIDGDWGPGTRGAIAEWQHQQGAQPTGMLGPIQLQALRAGTGPVVGQRVESGACPSGFHPGRFGRRCWVNR